MGFRAKSSTLLLFFLSFFYFMPIFWDNIVFSFARNFLFICAAGYIFKKQVKPDQFLTSIFIYYAVIHIITALNGHVYGSVIVMNVKACIYIWLLKGMLERDAKRTTNCLYCIFLFYCIVNFLSVVLFPEGIYITEQYIDMWNGSRTFGNWFFGNKNTQSCWFLILVLLSFVRASAYRKAKRLTLWLISIISVMNMILVGTSTSAFVLVVASTALIILSRRKRMPYPDINSHIILAGYLVIEILLVFGMLTIIGPFVKSVFGKDLTFSGRATAVWPKVLLTISLNPIFGSGIISAEASAKLLANTSLVNAHNEVLQILWQGGVVLLTTVIIVFHNVGNSINSIVDKREKLAISIFLLAYLVGTLFEVMSGGFVFLILIALLYYASVSLSNHNRNIEE